MKDITDYFQSPNSSSDSSNILSDNDFSTTSKSARESSESSSPEKGCMANGSTKKEESAEVCQISPTGTLETDSIISTKRKKELGTGKGAFAMVQDKRKSVVNMLCMQHEESNENNAIRKCSQNAFLKMMSTSQILSKSLSTDKECAKEDDESKAGRKKQSNSAKEMSGKIIRKRKSQDETSEKKKRKKISSDDEGGVRNVKETNDTMARGIKKKSALDCRTICTRDVRVLVERINSTQYTFSEEKHSISGIGIVKDPSNNLEHRLDAYQEHVETCAENNDTSKKVDPRESKKTNSLLSYFNKVANCEKVEDERIMVTAVVHYPLTASGNKVKVISRKPKRRRNLEIEDEIQIIERGVVELVKSNSKDKNIVCIDMTGIAQSEKEPCLESELQIVTTPVRSKIGSAKSSSHKKWTGVAQSEKEPCLESELQVVTTPVRSKIGSAKSSSHKKWTGVAQSEKEPCLESELQIVTTPVRSKIGSAKSSRKKWKMRIRLANSSSEESPSPIKQTEKVKKVKSTNVKLKLTFNKGKIRTPEDMASEKSVDVTLHDETPPEQKEEKKQGTEVPVLLGKRTRHAKKKSKPAILEDSEEDGSEDEPIFEERGRRRRRHCTVLPQSSPEQTVAQQVLKEAKGSHLKSSNSCRTLYPKEHRPNGAMKLAPLFMPRKKNRRPDKAFLESRRVFLQSGIPDSLKKMVQIQRVAEEHELILFPSVSHVQQKDDNAPVWNLPDAMINQNKHEDIYIPANPSLATLGISISEMQKCKISAEKPSRPPRIKLFRSYLHSVKAESPYFPVYRTFKNLRDQSQLKQCKAPVTSSVERQRTKRVDTSKVEINNLQEVENSSVPWTAKYCPSSTAETVGNANSLRRLKKWLELWIQVKENSKWQKNLKDEDSSGNEFINDASDEEGKSNPQPKNTVVLLGPSGTGKTLAVYTVARELGYKVLEVNASSRRTGRRILSELLEATQSHQVQGSEQQTSRIVGFFKDNVTKKSQVSSQKDVQIEEEQQSNKLSLILVEDVDVVFEEEDEGFVSALSVLVAGSKRPVILVTSNENCPHLSRFTESNVVLNFQPVSAKIMGAWLQLISLLEGVRVTKSAMEELLNYHRGDIRRSILQLQLWVLSGGNNLCSIATTPCTPTEVDLADDASNSSWVSEDDKYCANEVNHPIHSECLNCFLLEDPYLLPVDLGQLWWNVPALVGLSVKEHRTVSSSTSDAGSKDLKDERECSNCMDKESEDHETKTSREQGGRESGWKSTCSRDDVLAMFRLADTLSTVDTLAPSASSEPAPCWWQKAPANSLSLKPDLRPCWSGATATLQALASWTVATGVNLCASQLRPGSALPTAAAYQRFLGREQSSWRQAQHLCDGVLWNAASYVLCPERRAMATDCLPSLRNIARLEQERSSANNKRTNRFFHYLKGIGVHASPSALNTACATFRALDSS